MVLKHSYSFNYLFYFTYITFQKNEKLFFKTSIAQKVFTFYNFPKWVKTKPKSSQNYSSSSFVTSLFSARNQKAVKNQPSLNQIKILKFLFLTQMQTHFKHTCKPQNPSIIISKWGNRCILLFKFFFNYWWLFACMP